MNSITAAIGLAQLERLDFLVKRRIAVGEMFFDVVKDCEYFVPQSQLNDSIHTYYTFGVRYLGHEMKGISWKQFYDRYTKLGGNGFYAAWVNPYLEPVLKGKTMGGQVLKEGLCPIAEKYQKSIMLFKTNHRNLEEAKKDANILKKLINEIS